MVQLRFIRSYSITFSFLLLSTGFTLQQVTTEPKLSPDHTWCKADFRQFNVRIGPDYNRHKKKAPSAAPIYEPFAVDVFW